MQSQWIQRANCKSTWVKMDKMGFGCGIVSGLRATRMQALLPCYSVAFLTSFSRLTPFNLSLFAAQVTLKAGGTVIQLWQDFLQTKHITWPLDTLSWVYLFLGLP